MALRRPEPEGFDDDLQLLVQLECEREDLQRRIDDMLIKLTVESESPTQTIAEHLKITSPAVSSRRRAALRRREVRQQAEAEREKAA